MWWVCRYCWRGDPPRSFVVQPWASRRRLLGPAAAVLLAVGLLAALLAAVPAAAQSTTVHIPDLGLRAFVEDALGKDAGDPITRAEMGALTSLNARGTLTASDQGITDTTGLQHATGLITLDLSHNNIETADLSALTGLTPLNRVFSTKLGPG